MLLWRYIAAPQHPNYAGDPDAQISFLAHTSLLQAGIAVVLLTLIYVNIQDFYPFNRLIARYGTMPGYDALTLDTLLLLFAAAATSFAPITTPGWVKTDTNEQRRLRIHNSFRLATFGIVALVSLNFFTQLMTWIHHKYGAHLWDKFHGNGNDAADMYGVVPTIVVAFSGAKMLFWVSRRIEAAVVPSSLQSVDADD